MLQIDGLDHETLKQVAVLLETEVKALHGRLAQQAREIARLRGKPESVQLELEMAKLKERIAQLERKIFAPSSEKRPHTESDIAAMETESSPQHGHGPRRQPDLPTVEQKHDLSEGERTCPACEGTLVEMKEQSEESEEVTVVERQFVLVKHKRQKYRCRCNGAVVTAPGPRKLIAGGRYSVELAVDIAVAKYLDHMPLERQTRVMAREGLCIDSHTLWDQIDALAAHLLPSYEALGKRALASEIVQADETWWRLMDKKSQAKWWAWCLATPEVVYYRILPTRSAQSAQELLADYKGIVVCDGYTVYKTLRARAGPDLVLVHCWAHVRRKFVEIEDFYPEQAGHVLELIGKMYATDELTPSPDELTGTEREDARVLRAKVRQTKVHPILEEIREWAYAQRATRESALRKAVEYMLGLWPGLVRFLDDPRVPLDNNRVERALRGAVIGRKNHYGSRSIRGTEVAALFYSLLETAKIVGVDEKTYLLQAAYAAIDTPDTVLLPHELRA